MTVNPSEADAFVIGGGVIGLSTALALQVAGVKTCLVAPDSSSAASWGNAGHIAVEQVEPLASAATVRSMHRRLFVRGGALSLPLRDAGAWLPFSLRLLRAAAPARFAAGTTALGALLADALPAWRRLVRMLDAPELLAEQGHIVVWESEATARDGRARWMRANTGSVRVDAASDADLAAVRAQCTVPIAGGVRFDGSGQITDLPALAGALAAAFGALGGQRLSVAAASLARGGQGVTIRLADGRSISAPTAVIAAGAASGRLLAPLGIRVPLIAERGYHIQSPGSAWPSTLPPVVFEDRSMIVTRFRGGLRAASFVEFGRIERPGDPAKWRRLRAHVAALGLDFPEPVSEWMGARPTLPDYLPAIGRSAEVPGLIYAFGHQHLGLTLAATTAEAVRALIVGDTPPADLAPFDLARFGGPGRQ